MLVIVPSLLRRIWLSRWTVLASTVLALAAAWSLTEDGKAGFWVSHPMLGSFISGVLLFLFVAVIVERHLKRREEKKWRQVARLSCHALGDEGSRRIVTGLAALWSGPDICIEPAWYVPEDTRSLVPEENVRELPPGASDISVFARSELPLVGPYEGLVPLARLAALTEDEEWRAWACTYVQALRNDGRRLLASWAPVLLAANEPRRLLGELATLNDDLGRLRVALPKRGKATPATARRVSQEVVELWLIADAHARVLTNALWVAAGEEEWAWYLPRELRSVTHQEAFDPAGPVVTWARRSVAEWDRMHPPLPSHPKAPTT
jgi:hypothetical protein